MFKSMKKSSPILKEIAKDIYLLSISIPMMQQVNCFLFRGENGFTLVDTGLYTEEGVEIWEDLITSGVNIEKVVLTHFHVDHIGFAKWFQQKHHVPVYISRIGYEEMKKRNHGDNVDWLMNLFRQHGALQLFNTAIEMQFALEKQMGYVYEFEPDGLLEDNQTILLGRDRYKTIWTPGHSRDHFCFYNHEREITVIGDHIVEHLAPVVLIESAADVNPLMSYYHSLEKMKNYSTQLALPGHGKVMENVNKRIEDIKAGHHYRMEQILELLRNEEKTAGQLSQEIYRKMDSKFGYSPVMSTIVRCIYLESIGKLTSQSVNGKRIYKLC